MARIHDALERAIFDDVYTGEITLSGLDQEAGVDLHGQAGAAFGVYLGTLVGTLIFEGSVDGTQWYEIRATRAGDGEVMPSPNADGIYFVPAMGLDKVRVRVNAYTSGSADVAVKVGQGSVNPPPVAGEVSITEPVSVDDNGSSLTVDSAQLPAALAAGGGLKVEGVVGGVAQPISAAALPLPAGAATAALQTQPGVDIGDVTVNNAAGAAAVNVQDGGNSLTVDGAVSISGTPTVDTELAAAAALADLTPNPTVPTVGAAQMVYNGASWDRARGSQAGQWVEGPAAHDAPKAGSPLRAGASAESTELAAVADGDVTDVIASLNGKLIVLPYAVPERSVAGVTVSITGTSDTQVIAAPGAGLRLYITQILVTNGHATVGTYVLIKDGTTTIYAGYARQAGGGFSLTFPVPLRLTANTALQAANITTGSDTRVSASGFIAP